MLFYIAHGLVTTFIAWLSNLIPAKPYVAKRSNRSNFPWLALSVIAGILVFTATVRFGIGSDYFLYRNLYASVIPESLRASLQSSSVEVGFTYLMFVLKTWNAPFEMLLFFSSALTVIFVLLGIRRASKFSTEAIFLYIFLGCYVVSFNAVRQSIAVAIFFYADTFRKEKPWLWLLLSFAASLFHASVLIALIFQVLTTAWRPSLAGTIFILLLAGLTAASISSFGWLQSLSGTLNSRYEDYWQMDPGGIGTSLNLVAQAALCLYIVGSSQRSFAPAYKGFLIASVVVMIFAQTSWVIARLDQYFLIFTIVLLPEFLSLKKTKVPKLIIYGALIVFYAFYVTFYNQVVPYETSFSS